MIPQYKICWKDQRGWTQRGDAKFSKEDAKKIVETYNKKEGKSKFWSERE